MIVPSFSILSGAHPGAESKAEGFSLWNELRDVSPANAPEGDILDITEPFFRIDKTYYIQSFINLMLFGSDGDIDKAVKRYGKGQASVTVRDKVMKITFEDGSGSPRKVVGGLKNCSVLKSSRETVTIPMYVLDDGSAIRVVQSNSDRKITVYEYGFNRATQKYVNLFCYILYQ